MATLVNSKKITIKPSKIRVLLENKISSLLYKKYFFDENYYNSCLINDIIYNEKSHIVALFKNYLILDDDSEFLKRFYTKKESAIRLPKFFEYYDTYSKIFPNYTILAESKYIFKNIHKKQKMIDLQQENESKSLKDNNHNTINESKTDEVFSTDVYNSIVNDYDDIAMLFNIKRDDDNNININSDDTNNDNNDIKKLGTLIDLIAVKQKKMNSNKKINKQKTCTSDYFNSKKTLLTPRIDSSCKQPNISNKLMPKENSESISRYIQQELLIQKKKSTVNINKSNDNSIKYDKMKLMNSRSYSIHQKILNSTAMTPHVHNNAAIRPLTHRESSRSKSKIQDNDITNNNENNKNIITPSETERIKVNIRPMKEEKEMKKNNIISQIRANNKFFFQSKIIASQFNQNLKLGTGNRENLLSPQSTTRGTNNEKEISNANNVMILKKDKQQNNKYELELLKPNCNNNNHHYQDKKGHKVNKDSKSKDIGIHTSRPKSRTNKKLNIPIHTTAKNNIANNKHLVINDKKDLHLNHIQSFSGKSPTKKIVKGIEIKNFSKALGLLEMPIQKTITDRHDNSKGNKVKIPV